MARAGRSRKRDFVWVSADLVQIQAQRPASAAFKLDEATFAMSMYTAR